MFRWVHRAKLPPRFKQDTGAVGLLVGIFFATNFRLISGTALEHWDGTQFFAPFYSFLARVTRSGHLLLWNPFSSGGSPDFAEPQIGAFSPVMLLFGWLAGPSPEAFRWYWLCVWFLGGLGMYVLARALAAPPWGALLASVGLVFSGYYFGHAQHTSVVYSFSFVPWIVWRLRAAVVTGKLWPACEAGALWGLSALAGNPAVVIPAGLFVSGVAAAWVPESAGSSPLVRWRHYGMAVLLLALVGIVVLAPSYLSFRYEVAGYSARSLPLPREVVMPQERLGFRWLATLLTPAIPFATGGYVGWANIDVSYVPMYCGAALPILAAYILWQRRAWSVWWIGAMGLLFLGFALGASLPLRGWLYDLLPPTRFIRHAPMFRGFAILTLAMLVAPATGLIEQRRVLAQEAGRHLQPLAALAAGFAVLATIALTSTLAVVPPCALNVHIPLACSHLAVAAVGLAALCLGAVLRPGLRRHLPTALVTLTVIDLTGAYLLSQDVTYHEGAYPSPPQFDASFTELGADGFRRAEATAGNRNLYVPKPVFVDYTAMVNNEYASWGRDSELVHTVAGANRLWFVPDAPVVPATPEVFAAFQERVHAIDRLIVLRHERETLLRPGNDPGLTLTTLRAIAAAPVANQVTYQIQDYQANHLLLDVTCPAAGFLLVTDRWSRSWTAAVNGRPVAVEGGNFLFRLVPVTAGRNRVEMVYQVSWLYPLLAASWTTLAAVALGSFWTSQRPKFLLPTQVAGIELALERRRTCPVA